MGYDIQFDGRYDTDLARMDFEDAFKRLDSRKTRFDTDDVFILRGFNRGECKLFVTRGHCQGDYAEVFAPDMEWMQESIDNLFWNTPVSANLTINNSEYSYFDFDLDTYTWDRQKFIDKVVQHRCKIPHEGLKQALIDVLPKELEII